MFTLVNIAVARFKPRDDISTSAKRGHAARTQMLHAKCQIRFAKNLGSERDHERFGGCVRDHVVWAVPLRHRADDTLYIGEGMGIE